MSWIYFRAKFWSSNWRKNSCYYGINNPSHNIDHFTYEHILRDTEWLSDCDWMYDKSKSVENSVNYINVLHITSSNDDN